MEFDPKDVLTSVCVFARDSKPQHSFYVSVCVCKPE